MANSARASCLAGVLAAVFVHAGCGFPDHNFIEDGQFYAIGGSGAFAPDAGVGGGGALGVDATHGSGGTGGANGSGSTRGTSGGGASTGGGGTGGGTAEEDCMNGVDDDADGEIDCADSDCASLFTCVPLPPAGWTGPVALFEGPGPAPDCNLSGGYPLIKQNASAGLSGGNATCPTCTCGTPTSATCSAELHVFAQTSCTGPGWGAQPLTSEPSCQLLPALCHDELGPPKSVLFKNTQMSGGKCQAKSTGTMTIPTPTWGTLVRACGDAPSSGTGCGTTGGCLPKPAPPFGSTACVYQPGDLSCPAPFSTKKLGHLSFTDSRECQACQCGAAAAGTCSAPYLALFTNDSCSVDTQYSWAEGFCMLLTTDPTAGASVAQCLKADTRSAKLSTSATGGACPPSGGQLSGSLEAAEPVTFCCL